MKLLGFSANNTRPSKTRTLVDALAAAVAAQGWAVEVFDLVDLGPGLSETFSREQASDAHRRMWQSMAEADALVVGSGVYKASYSGLMKHVFDLLEPDLLAGKSILPVATGGAAGHSLMIDHQMRPLFSFFRALTLPEGLYATAADFDTDGKPAPMLAARISARANDLVAYSRR